MVTTARFGLEQQVTGTNNNSWGTELNTVLDNIDAALGDVLAKSFTSSDVTLSTAENRSPVVVCSGTLTANVNLIVANERPFWVYNNTSGAFSLTVKTAAGTGIAVAQGQWAKLYCDATNVLSIFQPGDLAALDTVDTAQIDDDAITTAKIADSNVTLAKHANIADGTILGNNTGGAAAPVALTGTQATALLNAFVGDSGSGGTKGLVPAPSANDADTGKLKLLGAGATWYRPTWHFIEEVGGTGANLTSTADYSGYDMLRIHFWFDASSDDILQMQVASSGPTWLTGTQYDIYANPVYSRMDTGSTNSVAEIVSNGAYWRLTDGSIILEAGTAGITGTLLLSQFSAAKNSLLTGDIVHQGTSGGVSYVTVITSIAGVLQSATALTNFRFYWSGGSTFASGSYFAVEGRKFG